MDSHNITKLVLTIDLEDWFHSLESSSENWQNYDRRIEFSTNKVLELLSENNCRATFFILGDVASNHPELIKRINDEGHEIGSHGYYHKFVYHQSILEFKEDLRNSVLLLSDLLGKAITTYRAPCFSITKNSLWALNVLYEEGIKIDSSVFPVFNKRYGISKSPRLPYQLENGLWEWPITTFQSFMGNIPFAGGVYFRLLPYKIFKFFLSGLIEKKEPILFYFHPWELDPDQPMVKKTTPFLRVRHYYGLSRTYRKLSCVIKDYKTISLTEGLVNFQSKNYE
jgi:polysaccharide deacetylase family protein (PEP-CTERM system associated)